jgi:hypothetical protein
VWWETCAGRSVAYTHGSRWALPGRRPRHCNGVPSLLCDDCGCLYGVQESSRRVARGGLYEMRRLCLVADQAGNGLALDMTREDAAIGDSGVRGGI